MPSDFNPLINVTVNNLTPPDTFEESFRVVHATTLFFFFFSCLPDQV